MIKLFKSAPKLDKQYYKTGDYEKPIHHSQNNQTPRLYLVAGLFNYLLDRYTIKTVTDLGCGDGGLLSMIYKPNIEFIGYDLAEKNINHAREQFADKANVQFVYSDFITEQVNQTDVAICCETLEHLVNPKKLLKELPCTYLIASVPMNENKDIHGKHHLWAWTEQEFRKMIKNCGYKLIHTARANERTQIILAEKL